MNPESDPYTSATGNEVEPGSWEDLVERGVLEPLDDATPTRLPEEWENESWDEGRLEPKSPAEAAAAARERGEDPAPYGVPENELPGETGGGLRAAAGTLYVPWLPDAARLTGYPVLLEPGWNGRGHGGMRVLEGVVGHHTATSETAAGDYPSLRVVRDGRAGLPGPLAQLGLARSGAIIVIANGLAHHAGVSAYAGFYDLNDEFLGIEAEDSGDGKWTPAQLDAYPRLVAALLYYMKRPAERYCSHRTCAKPAGRKIDPAGITDAWMQDRVRTMLADPLARIPRTTDQEDDVTFTDADRNMLRDIRGVLYAGDRGTPREQTVWYQTNRKVARTNPDGTNVEIPWIQELADSKTLGQAANAKLDQVLETPPTTVDAAAVAEALANNDEFITKLAERFAAASLDEQARRLAE